jgi:prophage regulatory protein
MKRILRKPEVISRTGLSDQTIWRKEKAGEFPQRVQLGPNSIGWIEAEITEWIVSRERGIPAAPANIIATK